MILSEGMIFNVINSVLTLLFMGGLRISSNFAVSGNPLTFKYITMIYADFSYLSIATLESILDFSAELKIWQVSGCNVEPQ